MSTGLYFLIGVIYADVVLIDNMVRMRDFSREKFTFKLACYIGDVVIWPFSLIGSIALYFIKQ